MNVIRFASVLALFFAASAFAQTASLTAVPTILSAAGGEVALTASASYDGEPGALGWSIALPASWTLVSVSGPNVPAITPKAGTNGTLEFAYTAVPVRQADFTVIVRYPAGTPAATAISTALIRAAGQLKKVTPAPVIFEAR